MTEIPQTAAQAGPLPDHEIERLAREQNMISPFLSALNKHAGVSHGLSSFGYDIRLGRAFKTYRWRSEPLCPLQVKDADVEVVEGDTFELKPGGFVLAYAEEWMRLPDDVVAFVTDKSTYARCGIALQNTVLEPGWEGQITLEINNQIDRPILLTAGAGIAQVVFFRGGACRTPYHARSGKYQGQHGVTLPRS